MVHWPLKRRGGGLLHLLQRGGAWIGCSPAQSLPHCTTCNSPPINSQCTNFILFNVALYITFVLLRVYHSHILITCKRYVNISEQDSSSKRKPTSCISCSRASRSLSHSDSLCCQIRAASSLQVTIMYVPFSF